MIVVQERMNITIKHYFLILPFLGTVKITTWGGGGGWQIRQVNAADRKSVGEGNCVADGVCLGGGGWC